jgi:hypothetical protein
MMAMTSPGSSSDHDGAAVKIENPRSPFGHAIHRTPVAQWHLCTSARPPASATLDPIPSDDRTDGVPAEDNKQTLINADSTLATFTIGGSRMSVPGGPRVRA